MNVLWHHDITDQMKLHLVAHLPQLFHKNVSRVRRLQQRQPPVTTERNKMQMSFAVIPLQSRRHRHPKEGNVSPKTQVQTPNPGHPPPIYKSTYKCRTDILCTVTVSTNSTFGVRATRPRALHVSLDRADAIIEGGPDNGLLISTAPVNRTSKLPHSQLRTTRRVPQVRRLNLGLGVALSSHSSTSPAEKKIHGRSALSGSNE
jgi:hypothetical protein